MASDGFVSHRKSNSENLEVKYGYLLSFSHKLLSEAHSLHLKQKFDPDQTRDNYMMAQNHKLLQQGEYL